MDNGDFSVELSTDLKDNNLKHIKVYNKLYDLITNGVFPIGYQLPSEPELASKMQVSRVTLRRSLALLRDDGLISNIRGKGNFVISPDSPDNSLKFVKEVQHPFYACTTNTIDEVELSFKIDPPTETMLKSLKTNTSVVVTCKRWYKTQGKVVGFSLTFVPVETVTQYKIDLNEPKELELFLENTIYSQTIKAFTVMEYTTEGNIVSGKYKFSDKDSFIILYEDLFSTENQTIMHTRHYIPTEHFRVHFNLSATFEF